ncbi:DMT family transporter [Schlesneria paludicola]|uniref:DMT family transporter n=1 Tax=Schlesneria paludicola TaxID=360056 RepID=UPI00029A46C3|nr:DMT family transporter [Schlesneria paludicola]
MPYFWFVVICLIWGSSFVLMKRATLCLSPIGVGAGRAIGGTLVLALIFLFMKQKRTIRREDFLPLVAVVILGFVWPHSLQPEMVARHGGAFVGMTVGFTPLLTILVSIPILGLWPTKRQTIGVIGALACMLLLLMDLGKQSIPLTDILLTFSVPLTYSVANGIIRRSLKHLPPLELTLLCLASAGAVMLPLSLVVGNHREADPNQFALALASVAILGVVGTGIATFLFNRMVQQQGPLFAAMTTNLVPVGAFMWGHSDGERISTMQVAALVGILAMVTFVQVGAARPAALELSSAEQ